MPANVKMLCPDIKCRSLKACGGEREATYTELGFDAADQRDPYR